MNASHLSRHTDREHMILTYRYLCKRGARKFVRPGLEHGDLEQVAAIGLIKACDRYDTSLRTPFEAYAWIAIVGELMNHLRAHTRSSRCLRATPPPPPHDETSIEERISVERACASLSSQEQSILCGVYGLGLQQKEVAEHLSLSTRHVGRLHRRALTMLQRRLSE